ncbi:MAG: hypothetical protein ABW168_03065 [Sedimenticola sp.]
MAVYGGLNRRQPLPRDTGINSQTAAAVPCGISHKDNCRFLLDAPLHHPLWSPLAAAVSAPPEAVVASFSGSTVSQKAVVYVLAQDLAPGSNTRTPITQ